MAPADDNQGDLRLGEVDGPPGSCRTRLADSDRAGRGDVFGGAIPCAEMEASRNMGRGNRRDRGVAKDEVESGSGNS